MVSKIETEVFDTISEEIETNISESFTEEIEVKIDNPYFVLRTNTPLSGTRNEVLSKISSNLSVNTNGYNFSFTDLDKEDGDFVYTIRMSEQNNTFSE